MRQGCISQRACSSDRSRVIRQLKGSIYLQNIQWERVWISRRNTQRARTSWLRLSLRLCRYGAGYNLFLSRGYNSSGQLGGGCSIGHKTPVPQRISINYASKVASGHKHLVAIDENGDVHAWGANDEGQCGFESEHQINYVVQQLVTLHKIVDVVCGYEHTLALSSGGEVYSWGQGEGGLLGQGDTFSYKQPKKIEILKDIKKIYCGGLHSLALTQDNRAYTWGRGEGAQLGYQDLIKDESGSYQSTPKEIQIKNIISAALGDAHTLVLLSNGTVYGWGYCNSGQLGLGITAKHNEGTFIFQNPQLVEALEGIVIEKVYGGSLVSYFVTINGELLSCGDSNEFQIGRPDTGLIRYKDRTTTSNSLPMEVTALKGHKTLHVAVGLNHTLCSTLYQGKSRLYAWGVNKNCQLGFSDAIVDSLPIPIPKFNNVNVNSISVGAQHSCVVIGLH